MTGWQSLGFGSEHGSSRDSNASGNTENNQPLLVLTCQNGSPTRNLYLSSIQSKLFLVPCFCKQDLGLHGGEQHRSKPAAGSSPHPQLRECRAHSKAGGEGSSRVLKGFYEVCFVEKNGNGL